MVENVVGKEYLAYDRNQILYGGDTRFSVFKGTLNIKPVVVNRTTLITIETTTKNEDLSKLLHPNIARLLYVTTDADFRYDALEPYESSLDRVFLENNDPNKYYGPMPSNKQVLLQLANGLGYLHSLNILHGDIKPENILISSTGESVQMKWTRFGFRQSNLNDSYLFTPSATRMSPRKWWPPEMYENKTKQITVKGEIFSAGCVFLYFLSGGLHPFASPDGGEFGLEMNVLNGNPNRDNLIKPQDLSPSNFESVVKMIKKKTEKRVALRSVISDLERQDLNNQQQFNFPSLPYMERNGRNSCGLYLSKPDDKLVVKRIPINHCSDQSSIKKFSELNHSNVVRLLECYEEPSYKYFRLEFCSASLDQRFLPEEDPKKYTGPMPSHEQVFIQLVTGLEYIHLKGLVHGSIKPSNILINVGQFEDPQIQLADFGLMAQRWDSKSIDSDALFPGFQSEHYWLAPELREILKYIEPNGTAKILQNTRKSDIYSTGKVFFYYYHQSYAELQINSKFKTENQEYVFKKLMMDNYVYDKIKAENISAVQLVINEMTKPDFESRLPLKKVIDHVKSFELTPKGELDKLKDATSTTVIQFSRKHILGLSNRAVYLGMWSDYRLAAVKRIEITSRFYTEIEREQQLQQLKHCNIVEFYGSGEDKDFMHIVMEKCLMSVDVYCRQPQLYRGVIPMPSDREVLLQMATGLQYLHSQNLIHRDVKPGNILISGDKPAVLKWSDFGVSKKVLHSNGTEWTSRQGTKGWMAPEVDVEEGNVIAGEQSDLFSLGCVFFYFLTSAIHPFGNSSSERRKNIKNLSEPKNINELSEHHFAFNIIKEMIKMEPLSRCTITKVIEDLNALSINRPRPRTNILTRFPNKREKMLD